MEARNVDASLGLARLAFGNAVLSCYPLEEAAVIDLPVFSKWEAWMGGKKRGSACTVRLPGGRGLRVLPVHWDTRSEDIRLASADVIAKYVSKSALPCVVAGDFNSTPPGYPHSGVEPAGRTAISKLLDEGVLYDSGDDRSKPPHFTFPSPAPVRTIDWILVSSDLRGRLRDVRTLASLLSDHRPVTGMVLLSGMDDR